jgi:hypothetical protein
VVGQTLHTGQLSPVRRGLPISSPHGHGAHVVGALVVGHVLQTGHELSPVLRVSATVPHGHVGQGDFVVGQVLQIGQPPIRLFRSCS